MVKEEHFDLPSTMSKTDYAEFFARQVRAEPQYWHKLSFTLIYLLSQIKSAKKDIRKLLQVEGDDTQLQQLSLKELYSMLRKEAGVILSENQIELLTTFIDPFEQSVTIPKFKFDLTKLVDLLEKQLTVSAFKAAKIMTF